MVNVDRVGPAGGLSWIGRGWRIFKRSPGTWMSLASIWLALFMTLSGMGMGGGLVAWILSPVVLAGLLFAAHEAEEGRPVKFVHLVQGFRDSRVLIQLSIIGGLIALMAVISLAIGLAFVGEQLLTRMQVDPASVTMADFGPNALNGFLIIFVFQLFVFTAIMYAIPLVMLKRESVWRAIGASLYASVRNFLPLLVFAVAYVAMLFVISVPLVIVLAIAFSPAGLQWFPVLLIWILFPASVGMWYVSYREMFGI